MCLDEGGEKRGKRGREKGRKADRGDCLTPKTEGEQGSSSRKGDMGTTVRSDGDRETLGE